MSFWDDIEKVTNKMGSSSLGKSERAPLFNRAIAKPAPVKAKMAIQATRSWAADLQYHETLFDENKTVDEKTDQQSRNVHTEEITTTPLFSANVLASVLETKAAQADDVLPQYGLLAKVLERFGDNELREVISLQVSDSLSYELPSLAAPEDTPKQEDNRLFININAPWSAFICGSQGSGKSHTVSCMLEVALLPSKLVKSVSSSKIPVRVLVSPSNFYRMKKAYDNLPGFPPSAQPPRVIPLLLQEKHLNVERMMKLMAVDEDGKTSLYVEVVCRILRSMAMKDQNATGLDYYEFRRRIELESFNPAQVAMINIRLDLLESFMHRSDVSSKEAKARPQFQETKKGKLAERQWESEQDARRRAQMGKADIWSFEPGTLTIVDLSCPFVDESAACAMFNICLALFLEGRAEAGRIVVLDEAHKFMTGTDSGNAFTESLLSVIRQQRHLATRVIIATQEPTISPNLLDLSSMTIVHRFTSPAWLKALRSHLAGVSNEGDSTKQDIAEIFKRIVNLEAGQALLFSPSAMLTVDDGEGNQGQRMLKLGTQYVKMRVRKRLTADGGRSIMAFDWGSAIKNVE